jgi:hypothetical protein
MKHKSRGAFVRWWLRANPPAPWPAGFGPNARPADPEQFLFPFARPVQLEFWF